MAYHLSSETKRAVSKLADVAEADFAVRKLHNFLNDSKKDFITDLELGGEHRVFIVRVNRDDDLVFINHEIEEEEDVYGVGVSLTVSFDYIWRYEDGMIVGESNFPSTPSLTRRKFVFAENMEQKHYGGDVVNIIRRCDAILRGKQNYQEWEKTDVKVGRNDPCLCGSGKKYKKCCMKR
jgi:hypothetical protein